MQMQFMMALSVKLQPQDWTRKLLYKKNSIAETQAGSLYMISPI